MRELMSNMRALLPNLPWTYPMCGVVNAVLRNVHIRIIDRRGQQGWRYTVLVSLGGMFGLRRMARTPTHAAVVLRELLNTAYWDVKHVRSLANKEKPSKSCNHEYHTQPPA